MPIPDDILSVQRPRNTIVYAYGKNLDHYGVRERASHKSVNGRSIPINGRTVGHIVDHTFVPVTKKGPVSRQECDYKSWAEYTYCDRLFKDILSQLYSVFEPADALRLYVMAIIRTCRSGLPDHELKNEYSRSFLSEMYPDICLSKNTVGEFQNKLGEGIGRIRDFMKLRASNIQIEDNVIIDGTLKTNDSKTNTFSYPSRKARLKNRLDISILYAYDSQTHEPICSECFPGNMIDSMAGPRFLRDNQIESGLIVGDKGFPPDTFADYLSSHPNLHYLLPLKRNSAHIRELSLYEYEGSLDNYPEVLYKKVSNGKEGASLRWYYSYKDTIGAQYEVQNWMERYKARNNSRKEETAEEADQEKTAYHQALRIVEEIAGTIVMESDVDMSAEEAYTTYEGRWQIELVMKYYKIFLDLDNTKVHEDYSVVGCEFINFLASVLTMRIVNDLKSRDLLKGRSLPDVMRQLRGCKKIKINGEWTLASSILDKDVKLLQEIGLIEKEVKRKRGRPADPNKKQKKKYGKVGRPPKPKDPEDALKPRRGRGRPKGSKNKPKVLQAEQQKNDSL